MLGGCGGVEEAQSAAANALCSACTADRTRPDRWATAAKVVGSPHLCAQQVAAARRCLQQPHCRGVASGSKVQAAHVGALGGCHKQALAGGARTADRLQRTGLRGRHAYRHGSCSRITRAESSAGQQAQAMHAWTAGAACMHQRAAPGWSAGGQAAWPLVAAKAAGAPPSAAARWRAGGHRRPSGGQQRGQVFC